MSDLSKEANLLATQYSIFFTPLGDFSTYNVVRRTGDVVEFNPNKIALAITKAYIAVHGHNSITSNSVRDQVSNLTNIVIKTLKTRRVNGGSIHIEEIQDQVELALMRNGEYEVARKYILYREERSKERSIDGIEVNSQPIHVINANGEKKLLNLNHVHQIIKFACEDLSDVDPKMVLDETLKNIYDGVREVELYKSMIFAARQLIEYEPAYNFVTARLLLHTIINDVLDKEVLRDDMQKAYVEYFSTYIERGIEAGLISPLLREFDIKKIANSIDAKRDLQFKYLGLQTLYDRYFLHINDKRIELPQIFFMRVAMGLALNEENKTEKAIEFYNILSSFDFMSSTPTLFNAGTLHSQLSSCYLTTIEDDLAGIYDAIKENALLSKFAGGLGNDWTNIRALGSRIKGTNGKSQGVIPFLKVVNDTAVAVNQGGKRRGAVVAFLETWHCDIEEFLDLRKNTGDERRRCHDMNTANWIPDLFMKRVHEQGEWTLFSPNEVPDLHDKYGKEFEEAYVNYEKLALEGKIKSAKKISSLQLWRKMLTMLFETGHPWITFKDACNIRSPQQHFGVVHSSNLCTEITLNTNKDEIAVCNLGSVNLVNHIDDNGNLNINKLEQTINLAIRMLDNVIDINFYPVKKAETSNLRHRPIGLGIMGFHDALYKLRIPYASNDAVEFADKVMEYVSYYAIQASSNLAHERGAYSTFKNSLWDRGIFPLDTINLLEEARGTQYVDVDKSSTLNWSELKKLVKTYGMRNSNTMAIAPTATISNIVGVSSSIDPTYQNIFVKSNLSGEFTVVNEYLVNDLKKLKLWDEIMLADIKYFDGSLSALDRIPDDIKKIYATAFEIDSKWLVNAGSRRQKWIDQAQSLNLYVSQPSGKKLDELYKLCWIRGLKCTYYLRTLAATSAEKSTGSGGELNAVEINSNPNITLDAKFCSIDNLECESCQ